MRMHGLNIFESFLDDYLAGVGWLLALFTIVTAIFLHELYPSGLPGGVLGGATVFSGILLLLGSAGIRQNRAPLDVGYGLFTLTALAWVVEGVLRGQAWAIVAGVVMGLVLVSLLVLHHEANVTRYKPRYLSIRQLETLIAVAETIIDTDGQTAVSPIDVALRIDWLLAEVDSPVKADLQLALNVTEWVLPLLILRPFPFSDLGSTTRRSAVEAVIEGGGLLGRGVFRTLARTLKVAACIGYYGSPDGMAQVGYVPFEERERSHVDQTPKHYPDPLLKVTTK
jgi:hypothetical protein